LQKTTKNGGIAMLKHRFIREEYRPIITYSLLLVSLVFIMMGSYFGIHHNGTNQIPASQQTLWALYLGLGINFVVTLSAALLTESTVKTLKYGGLSILLTSAITAVLTESFDTLVFLSTGQALTTLFMAILCNLTVMDGKYRVNTQKDVDGNAGYALLFTFICAVMVFWPFPRTSISPGFLKGLLYGSMISIPVCLFVGINSGSIRRIFQISTLALSITLAMAIPLFYQADNWSPLITLIFSHSILTLLIAGLFAFHIHNDGFRMLMPNRSFVKK